MRDCDDEQTILSINNSPTQLTLDLQLLWTTKYNAFSKGGSFIVCRKGQKSKYQHNN